MSAAWGPVKVCLIDVERCPAAIGDESRYAALWALVRERGRPRGLIRLPFTGGLLDRDLLERAIQDLPSLAGPVGPLERSDGDGATLPAASVVISSTMQREAQLEQCLRSIEALDYPEYEVILVDNGRSPGAPEVALTRVRVVREPRRGLSAARNRGLAEARAPIVAFTDDDVEVDRLWLRALVQRLAGHPDEVCTTGVVLPRELETRAQAALEEYYGALGPRSFRPLTHRLHDGARGAGRCTLVDAIADDGTCLKSFSLYASGSFGTGANMAFRADRLREIGGFDRALGAGTPARGGEELDVFARLAWRGHGIGFEPAAILWHNHYRDDAALRRQIVGYGCGYSAHLTALVLRDPWHLRGILGTLPRALRVMGRGYGEKLRESPEVSRDRELALLELRGLVLGPPSYLYSRFRRP